MLSFFFPLGEREKTFLILFEDKHQRKSNVRSLIDGGLDVLFVAFDCSLRLPDRHIGQETGN